MSDFLQKGVVGIVPAAIISWFKELGISATGDLAFERIGLGQSNLTYLVRDEDDRRWILRRPPLGPLLASAHDVIREARIMSSLTNTTVPTPRILGVTKNSAISTVPLVLMEFIDGQVIDTLDTAKAMTAQRRRQITLSLLRTLTRIHSVDLNKVGLSDLASHKPYAARQLKRWAQQWEQSKTRELPLLDDLTRRLEAAVPTQQEISLVHGDFHLRNVIASRNSGDIIGVLDWELSTLGDPLADIGSLLAYWPEAGEDSEGDFSATTLEGFPDRAEVAQLYLEQTTRDPQALQFWHVLGLWKVAIIAEGVMRRAIDNRGNRAEAGTPTVEGIDALIHKAHEEARKAGI